MSILPQLIDLYRREGYEPLTGYNPHHFAGWMDAPFTVFLKDSAIHGSPGMALQEVMFLEGFAKYVTPKTILIIGNSFGWSTLALALIFPQAKILAIDPGEDGNALTRRVTAAHKLNIEAAQGKSPEDVSRLCQAHLGGKADLVLIDAIHTNEAMLTDFRACRPESHDGTIWLFHDVLNWNMVEAFQTLKKEAALSGAVLTRTPSGVAVAWKQAPAELTKYVGAFTEAPDIYRLYRKAMVEKVQDRMSTTVKLL